MYLQPLQPISESEIFVSGDVDIDPSAVISPGSILQAAPNSRIVIRAGVNVGRGVILNAVAGSIELEEGAILGAGVLIIGSSNIGSYACVGAATTIFETSIEAKAVIPAHSLMGDRTRQPSLDAETKHKTEISETMLPDLWDDQPEPELKPDFEPEPPEPEIITEPEPEIKIEIEITQPEPTQQSPTVSQKAPVVGQIYINQLLMTLFPQNPKVNPRSSDDSD